MLTHIKAHPWVQKAYRLPWLLSAYHFLWAFLGAVRYGFPSLRIKVVGVTGTKGKSTTLEFLNAAFEGAGKKTALLSSIRVKVGEKTEKNMTGNTMPGRFYIEQFLDRAVRAGCEYAFIEATSQGTATHRHRFIKWVGALITNIAPEHIEAHGSFKNYRAAKLSFLRYAASTGAHAFLNQEDQGLEWFFQALPAERTSFYSKELIRDARSKIFEIFPGDYNRENVAGAVAVARFMKINESAIWKGLDSLTGIPGRMEFVIEKPFTVIIDYAHTPDSLEAVYKALKEQMANGKWQSPKLICVFGSASGGRDTWKRPVMGRIAAAHCDKIILTNEDPYDEDPKKIVEEIFSGIPEGSRDKAMIELDRTQAIARALAEAHPGDTVVLTGKGSEVSIHGPHDTVIQWSEREAVEKLLRTKTGFPSEKK